MSGFSFGSFSSTPTSGSTFNFPTSSTTLGSTSAFGVPPTPNPTQTSSFGTTNFLGSPSYAPNSSTFTFGTSIGSSTPSPSLSEKFEPVSINESGTSCLVYHISAKDTSKSPEELRLEEYKKRSSAPATAFTSTTPFASTTPSVSSLPQTLFSTTAPTTTPTTTNTFGSLFPSQTTSTGSLGFNFGGGFGSAPTATSSTSSTTTSAPPTSAPLGSSGNSFSFGSAPSTTTSGFSFGNSSLSSGAPSSSLFSTAPASTSSGTFNFAAPSTSTSTSTSTSAPSWSTSSLLPSTTLPAQPTNQFTTSGLSTFNPTTSAIPSFPSITGPQTMQPTQVPFVTQTTEHLISNLGTAPQFAPITNPPVPLVPPLIPPPNVRPPTKVVLHYRPVPRAFPQQFIYSSYAPQSPKSSSALNELISTDIKKLRLDLDSTSVEQSPWFDFKKLKPKDVYGSSIESSPRTSRDDHSPRFRNSSGESQSDDEESGDVDNFPDYVPKFPDNSDYYTSPDITVLRTMSKEELSNVPSFTIGKKKMGFIVFAGKTDITYLDLQKIVLFSARSVEVYPEGTEKPPEGKKLNKAATITLFNVLPKKPNVSLDDWEIKLKKNCEERGTQFKEFDRKNGKWVFKVPHF